MNSSLFAAAQSITHAILCDLAAEDAEDRRIVLKEKARRLNGLVLSFA